MKGELRKRAQEKEWNATWLSEGRERGGERQNEERAIKRPPHETSKMRREIRTEGWRGTEGNQNACH